MKQILLDTETTGLDFSAGHKIIEIGCIEIEDRKYTGNQLHYYLNPERDIEQGAFNVHGITDDFLKDKPLFKDISEEFINFIKESELIIHNAPFDIGFIESEFSNVSLNITINEMCKIFDTLQYARKLHPGQKNSLEALCKRYDIDDSDRNYHGALKDAKLLGEVYLSMTGGQTSLGLDQSTQNTKIQDYDKKYDNDNMVVQYASEEELREHNVFCTEIDDISDNKCIWKKL